MLFLLQRKQLFKKNDPISSKWQQIFKHIEWILIGTNKHDILSWNMKISTRLILSTFLCINLITAVSALKAGKQSVSAYFFGNISSSKLFKIVRKILCSTTVKKCIHYYGYFKQLLWHGHGRYQRSLLITGIRYFKYAQIR